MKKYTIYNFFNVHNGKRYVGLTGNQYPSARKGQHLFHLRRNQHSNDHFQYAFNKYGEKAFVFDVLEKDLELNEAKEREVFYIKHFNTMSREYGYNIEAGGAVTALSEETIEKMRNSLKGRQISEKQRINHSSLMKTNNPMKGRSHTQETRAKMSEKAKMRSSESRKHREETKEKISRAHKGRVFSEETRKKMGDARRGKPLSPAQLEALEKARSAYQWKQKNKEKKKSYLTECSVTP